MQDAALCHIPHVVPCVFYLVFVPVFVGFLVVWAVEGHEGQAGKDTISLKEDVCTTDKTDGGKDSLLAIWGNLGWSVSGVTVVIVVVMGRHKSIDFIPFVLSLLASRVTE